MVKSRYNAYTYFHFVFGLLFLIGSIWIYTLEEKSFTIPAPLLGFMMMCFSVLVLYTIIKVLYSVQIDHEGITLKRYFKKWRIEKTAIESIDLFSMKDFYWSAGTTTFCTKITLRDGQYYMIADPFYSNISSLKKFLDYNFKGVIIPYKKEKPRKGSTINFNYELEKFAGNPFTSLNGILLAGLILFLSITVLSNTTIKPAHLIFIPVFLIFYFGFGAQLNYFLISDKKLIVRNHFLFWVKKEYDIENIIQVSREKPHKRSDDFKTKLYPAGSLRKKHWQALREKLESLDISVR